MNTTDNAKGKYFPLSLNQLNIWNLEQSYLGTSINNISTTVRIRGRIDFSLLQKSIDMTVASDPSLRTRITIENGRPVQYHAPYSAETFPIFDFSLSGENGISHWENIVSRETLGIIDLPLYRFYLFRMGEQEGGILVKVHHIVSDGWSQVQLCNKIGNTYLDLLSGINEDLEQAPSYMLHVEDEQSYLSSATYEKDFLFWQDAVKEMGDASTLKKPKSASLSPVGCRKTYELSEVLNHGIHMFCIKNRVAPFSVFYMALAIYLKRMGGSDRFNIGVPIFNRTNLTARRTTGMFVSTLPFFNRIDENQTFNEFNDRLMEQWYELLRHQKFPFTKIWDLAHSEQPDLDRLFHISLSYQDTKILKSPEASVLFSGQWHYSGYQSEQLCIHLSNLEDHKRYSVSYDYLTQLFSEEEIHRFHEYMCNILGEALLFPNRPIYQIPLLGNKEQEKVLYTFNRTTRPLYDKKTYDLFSKAVSENPKRVAVIQGGRRITYEDLDNAASAFASSLAELYPKGGHLIAVMLPRGIDLCKIMVAIMRSGNAWVLLQPNLPTKRISEILNQSGVSTLVTNSAGLSVSMNLPDSLNIFNADELDSSRDSFHAPVSRDPDDLAYVVYTSGTTGLPKGVEISQRSLLNLAKSMAPLYGQRAVLSICNTGFDAFLLESAVALLNAKTIVIGDEADEEDPRRLSHLISNHGVGFIATTPSRLSAYMNSPAFTDALRHLDNIICGGEPFSGELLQRLKTHTAAQVYNQYGPSETTVAVSYLLLNDCDVITVGSPMPNCRMYVLDSHLQPLPIGAYGNLYIGGVCVGRGYRNAPKLTADAFMDNPFEPGERLYNSGDMACWTEDGEIILAGRSDQQIKLRGLRVEPMEVSAYLATHPLIKESYAQVMKIRGQNTLIAYYTSDDTIPSLTLISYLADYLPSYMLPTYIRQIPFLPLTPNGKVDENMLPGPPEEKEYSGILNAHQDAVLSIFKKVLNNPSMTANADYFLYGGNSLNAMETIVTIERQFQKKLKVSDLYACRTALNLAEYLMPSESGRTGEPQPLSAEPIPLAPQLDSYPLTPPQESIYVQTMLDARGLAYNMPGALRFTQTPDPQRLRSAFETLIAKEEIFRTAFIVENGRVRQKILEEVKFDLPIIEASDLNEAAEFFIAPFDLKAPPLLRAALWRDQEEFWVLLIDTHHIIGDGLSTPLLLKRLGLLYKGEKVTFPSLNFRDYAYMINRKDEKSVVQHKNYWTSALVPLPEPLDLPVDIPRFEDPNFRGAHTQITLDPSVSQQCDDFCKNKELSPFMLFAAAFGLLVSKLTGSEDFILGTPVSVRNRPELYDMCGLFITTLPLRLRPEKDLSLDRYIGQVKTKVMELMDHQEFSLEEIITHLNLPRTAGENPLYRIMFSMRPLDVGSFTIDGNPMEYLPLHTGTSKLDLSVEAAKVGDSYSFNFEYATDSFERETIDIYGRSLETLLRLIIADENPDLSDISATSATDRINLIEKPLMSYTPYLNTTVDRMLDQMATICPDEPAIIFHGMTTTYKELGARATALAGLLNESGAKKGDHIALMIKRTPDMVAAMWGIMKAGCAYVPMLPSYPLQRLRYMLEVADVKLLLCDDKTKSELTGPLPCPILLTRENCPAFKPPINRNSDEEIHILFTSGSTGQPKGVSISHRSIANLISSMRGFLDHISGNILCTTNIVFDTVITETLIPLTLGKCIVLADEEEMMLPWKIAELIKAHNVKTIQMTPSRLQMCLTNDAFPPSTANLELVLLAGEVLSNQLLHHIKSVSSARILNAYGPAEASVYVTAGYLNDTINVSLGKPLSNCRIYILDESLKQVMPTATGELWISGECLSSGYAGRPDITAESFFDDPFFPGARMYRSGDLGRLRWDGSLSFLGRRDHQVKLNGQRIELDEISGAIQSSGLVSESAVILMTGEDGSKHLRAYVVPKNTHTNVSSKELRSFLSTVLPDYMIPSQVIQLERMPYTASHKIDRRALESFTQSCTWHDIQKSEESDTTQEKDVASLLVSIWKSTLHRDNIHTDISFFEQGGTSLAALCTLSEYYNNGLVLTLAQFYANPTVNAQLSLFDSEIIINEKNPVEKISTKSEPEFPCNVPYPRLPFRRKTGNVLITGATGFLGAHLVKALLDREETTIYCLVRDGDQKRLLNTLKAYFGSDWIYSHWHSLKVVDGDLRHPLIGLDKDEYFTLSKEISRVFHSAADVRHYAPENEMYETNVLGTAHIADFALKAGASLSHISTLSVSGSTLTDDPSSEMTFSEKDFFIGQNWQDNIYVKTKFLSEAEIYKRTPEGLCSRVFRIGRLVGRASDGMFQLNPDANLFYNMIRGILLTGAIPSTLANASLDLTAVDVCADAILALERYEHPSYHIIAPDPVLLSELAMTMNSNIKILDPTDFDTYVAKKLKDNDAITPAIRASILNYTGQSPAKIHPIGCRTHENLASRRFAWPKTEVALLLKQFIINNYRGGRDS